MIYARSAKSVSDLLSSELDRCVEFITFVFQIFTLNYGGVVFRVGQFMQMTKRVIDFHMVVARRIFFNKA